jgi:SAM-dependent methyltransferase
MLDDWQRWSTMFDKLYLRTYAALLDPADAAGHAEAIARILGLAPGADVLDCPCGYGRHSTEFARLGFHIVGADRSEVLLAEARRHVESGEWPQWVSADYRDLPLPDASFDCVLNLFSSLGYWGEEGDARALREFRRVLRPGGRLVVELMHRDFLMSYWAGKSWDDLPDGSTMLEEREFDLERGVNVVRFEVVEPDGDRIDASYELRVYSATELAALARAAGFTQIDCYGDFDGAPLSRESRLVLVAS